MTTECATCGHAANHHDGGPEYSVKSCSSCACEEFTLVARCGRGRLNDAGDLTVCRLLADHAGPCWFGPVVAEQVEAATTRQVGGRHYADRTIQPWHIIDEYELDFYAGNALKYLLRAGTKKGVPTLEDLRKCQHYLGKLIENEEKRDGR